MLTDRGANKGTRIITNIGSIETIVPNLAEGPNSLTMYFGNVISKCWNTILTPTHKRTKPENFQKLLFLSISFRIAKGDSLIFYSSYIS